MVQRLSIESCLLKYNAPWFKLYAMKKAYRNFLLSFVMIVAPFVGWVKGSEAKQKWVYKWKSSYNEKRQLAKKRMESRKGGVVLDEIEWASFHNN